MAKKNDKKAAEEAEIEVKTADQAEHDETTCKDTADSMQAELEKLKQECAQEKDRFMRLAAEYDNFRKRSQREKETSYGDAKAQTLSQILPVVDNFERAANNTDASLEDYVKGVTMTFSQMMEILKKLEVEPYGESGENFDPQIHSAVMHVEDEALGENIITDVFQKGYRMGDRILRHAMVKVAN